MAATSRLIPCLAFALALAAGVALADPPRDHGGPEHGGPEHGGPGHGGPAHGPEHGARPAPAHPGEAHPGPHGYERVAEPHGWNSRPATADRDAYRHNFQAARSFKIGPYHRPAGWVSHHWAYGQTLPRAYWTAPYVLADYWLFALEVPPAGYEWVRDDDDALLVDTSTGEILQVEYGVFG